MHESRIATGIRATAARSQTPLAERSWGFDSPRPYELKTRIASGFSSLCGDSRRRAALRSRPRNAARIGVGQPRELSDLAD